jgi:hypothetical protein
MKGGVTLYGKTFNTGIGDTLYSAANVARSGVASLIGLKKLTKDDFEKKPGFIAIRKPFNFSIYKLTYTKGNDDSKKMNFDFSVAGNVGPVKEAIFNSNILKIVNGVNELLTTVGKEKVEDTISRTKLAELNFTIETNTDIDKVVELLTRTDTGRQQLFKVLPLDATVDQINDEVNLNDDTPPN